MKDYLKPLPEVNGDNREFWEGCRAHELRFQKCIDCGHVRWPLSMICPKCHSSETEWIISNGKGTVYSFVIYHVAYHEGFKEEVPYVVADVKLEEGPQFLTNIVDCPHERIACDMLVSVVWDDVTEVVSLPKFRPMGT
jgi:uncharacterized OB-fold protein